MKKVSCKVGICGHFGGGKKFFDGQTVKTHAVTLELEKRLGKSQVMKVDTYGGKKKLLKCLKELYMLLIRCDNVIILPAHNSVRIFPLLMVVCNRFLNKRLHYIVIGGWLPRFLEGRRILLLCLKKFDCIYVETWTMKNALENQGFENIILMPNFKNISILKQEELVFSKTQPFKLCTFSRVMKEKGIEDAVEVIKKINTEHGKIVYLLDIYGQIEEGYKREFEELLKSCSDYVFYKGTVEPEKSVDVIRNYFFLMFPTRFYTEGIPGTIIDAYAAGVPVISSKWESFNDVVNNEMTGIGYEFMNINELERLLIKISVNPDMIFRMKQNCLKKAEEFMPKEVMRKMLLL